MLDTAFQIIVKYVSPILGLVGGFLGIVSFWRTIIRDRPKLRVTPVSAVPVGGAAAIYRNINFGIEVINLSPFAVIVQEVGFVLRGTSQRGAAMRPPTSDPNRTTPYKLEARESVTFYLTAPTQTSGKGIARAYASTACGRTFKGVSPALKGLDKEIRARARA